MSDLQWLRRARRRGRTEKAADTRWKLRVYTRGAILTMDLRRDRLNLELDDDGVVTRAWIG